MRHSCLLVAIGLAACTATSLQPVPLTEGYERFGFTISGGANVLVFIRTYRAGETVGLCGAWGVVTEYKVAERSAEIFMRDGKVFLGDTMLRRNLLFMNELGRDAQYESAIGNCVKTGVRWRA